MSWLKMLRSTPFASGPQDPLARPRVLERLGGAQRSSGAGPCGAELPPERACETLARTIGGPPAGTDPELTGLGKLASTARGPSDLPPELPGSVAIILEELWRGSRSEVSPGLSTWAIQAWARAVLHTEATPQELASLFATVTRQALEAKEFDTAREMFQGLDQLRAGAALLRMDGEVYLARRQTRDDRPLENARGLWEVARLGAVVGGSSLIDACTRLREEIAQLSGALAARGDPTARYFHVELSMFCEELGRIRSELDRSQSALETAQDTPKARSLLADHILLCCRRLDRLHAVAEGVIATARDVTAQPEPDSLGPSSLEGLLAPFDLSTARTVQAVDTTKSRGMLSAAALELTDAKGTTFWVRCNFFYQDPTRPEIFANLGNEILDLNSGPTAARLRELLHRIRPLEAGATPETHRCFQVFDAALRLLDPESVSSSGQRGEGKTKTADARA